MRLRRLSAPIRKALACAGGVCAFFLMLFCYSLYCRWHGREVWMWIDCANSPRVEQALQMGCSPNVRGAEGFPALCTASAVGSVETTRLLLKYGANPDLATPEGDTPVMFAARFTNDPSRGNSGNFVAIIHALVEHHANVNLRNRRGETALTLACRSGALENVQFLVEHGADINAPDACNATPFVNASVMGHGEIANYLAKQGARY